MSEEESFVILGSSPTDSMEHYSIIQRLRNQKDGENATNSASLTESRAAEEGGTSAPDAAISNGQSLEADGSGLLEADRTAGGQENDIPASVIFINRSLINEVAAVLQENEAPADQQSSSIPSARKQPGSMSGSDQNSLATSFLLGEVESDVLKASIFSQFPSLCGSQANPEDIAKLKQFLSEYLILKNTVQKNNTAMKEQFNYIQKFQSEYKTFKEQEEKRTKDYYEVTAKLQKEIIELKQELNDKINVIENIMKKENEELVRQVSEKTSIIQNMGVQIEKLEQNQHASFEYVKLNDGDKDAEHDYIRLAEHKRILKDITRQLSEVTAAKLELEDMKKIYIDEINCLKVNLCSAEELLRNNQSEISILKSKDIEKSDIFQKYDNEKEEMKQEINLLRAQLELYRKDFETERDSRQSLAGEKDQLINDLKMLQRRNQQLIEELASRMESESQRAPINISTPKRRSTGSSSSSSSTSTSRTPPVNDEQVYNRSKFVCPLCQLNFKCLDHLQSHVQDCLDKA